MTVREVQDLYVTRWGPPTRNARFMVDGLVVEVYKWDVEANNEGVNLYATIGGSVQPMRGTDPAHRIELITGLLPAEEGVASPLAAVALYPHREGVALGHGHTVPSAGPLWPTTDMDSFLILRPRQDLIPTLEIPDGAHVEFLQAIPILASDLAFKKKHGAEALASRWENSGVAFWDPSRTPETFA